MNSLSKSHIFFQESFFLSIALLFIEIVAMTDESKNGSNEWMSPMPETLNMICYDEIR